MRWRLLPVLLALGASACADRSGEAYLYDNETLNYLLNDDLPSRAWDVQIQADQLEDRSGPLWCTLRMDTSIVAGDADPWHDFWVDLWLEGTDMSEEHVFFQGPGSEAVPLVERFKTDCAPGAPCNWSFHYTAERRSGTVSRASAVVLSIHLQAVVALGDPEGAPQDPQIYVDLQEVDGDTGTP